MQFDSDGDGSLDASEFKRALHAIGLEKRSGDKADLDEFTFKQVGHSWCVCAPRVAWVRRARGVCSAGRSLLSPHSSHRSCVVNATVS